MQDSGSGLSHFSKEIQINIIFYVYILRSEETGKLYAGFSNDLKSRIKQHFSKDVHSTKRMGTLKLIFYEAFISERDARRREKYFKTTKGKRTLKLMLKDSLK